MEKEYLKVGEKRVINGVTYVCPDFYGQGTIFKDEEAFEKHPDEICYVPEYAFEEPCYKIEGKKFYRVKEYTRKDLEKLVQECRDSNEDMDEEELPTARGVFEICDWQYPETFLSEIGY